MTQQHSLMSARMMSLKSVRFFPPSRDFAAYILDFVGPIAGVRMQFPSLLAGDTIVQMSTVERHGLTLGTLALDGAYVVDDESPPGLLGLGLKWTQAPNLSMKTQIVRGMPYVTVQYSAGTAPAVAAELPLSLAPAIDGVRLTARDYVHGDLRGDDAVAVGASARRYRVQREVSLSFKESDMTWLLFFSRPATVEFYHDDDAAVPRWLPPGVVDHSTATAFELRVVDDDSPVIIRAALANNCTFGGSSLFCDGATPRDDTELSALLRKHADVYPKDPYITYDFPPVGPESNEATRAFILFDWGATSMSSGKKTAEGEDAPLLMYALPHHLDSMGRSVASSSDTGHCSAGIHGAACLVLGNEWILEEGLDGPPSFVALRPPHHELVPSLAEAVLADIHFELPDYYMAGKAVTLMNNS